MVQTTVSFWQDDIAGEAPPRAAQLLDCTNDVDYLVIGGGFSGLSTALELKRRAAGARITLVEAQRIGFGASGRNAGMLVPLAAPSWLIDGALPPDRARWAHAEFTQRFHALPDALASHDGGPAPASMVLCAPSSVAVEGLRWLHGQLSALGQKADLLDAEATRARIGEAARGSLVLAAYAIHPALLARSLAAAARKAGVSICEGSPVMQLRTDRAMPEATTASGVVIRAGRIICAAGAWTNGLLGRRAGAVAETWMLATAPLTSEQLACLGGPDSLVASLRPEFMYRRVHAGRLLLGALDDRVDRPSAPGVVPATVLPRLLRLLRQSLPWLTEFNVEQLWGGPIHSARLDELPRFRLLDADPRIAVIDGMSGSGVSWGLLAGSLAAGLVDPALDREEDRELRAALDMTRLPLWQAARLGLQLLLSATNRRTR